MRAAAAFMVVACLGAGPAFGNDSSAELAAGGLVLVKTDAIAMQREELTISPAEVRVRYEMRNDTGQPVTLRVAFPMPELPHGTLSGMETSTGGHNIMVKVPTDPNFMRFRVWADKAELAPEVEIKALLPGGRDIAAALREIGGLPLILRPGFFFADDYKLDEETQRKLRELGALVSDDPKAPVFTLPWTVYITFHWMQTFAPGVTVVEHSYRPVLGAGMAQVPDKGPILAGVAMTGGRDGDIGRAFCIDAVTDTAIRTAYRNLGHVRVYDLGYILRTARNWRGPVGTFHLTLENGPAVIENDFEPPRKTEVRFTSLCTSLALERTGPHRFEATALNYVPREDLRIAYFVD